MRRVWIHNISGVEKTYQGKPIANNSFYEIPENLIEEFSKDSYLISDIESEAVAISKNGIDDLGIDQSKAWLFDELDYSFAVEKGPDAGTDQAITGNDWTVVTHEQVLWDFNSDYDTVNDKMIIPFDGIYFFDGQIRLKNITNCTAVELALFKNGTPDDYWFILDYKDIGTETEKQLKASTSFNFYAGESYQLKIKLYGTNASADIDGSDDYTAWGLNFERAIL